MFEICEATTAEERRLAYELRFDVYVEEMGRPQIYADHQARTIHEPLDDTGHVFIGLIDGRAVGTIRTNLASDGVLECEDAYGLERFYGFGRDEFSMTTKFMVRRDFRHHPTLAARLAMRTFDFLTSGGIRFDFIDSNDHLIPLYQKMGYRRYQAPFEHPEYGTVTPMCLVADDLAHLRRVRSPFLRTAQRLFGAGQQLAAEFFSREFPEYVNDSHLVGAPHASVACAA